MIHENSPVTNAFVSVPSDMGQLNCAAYFAGIIAGVLDSARFVSTSVRIAYNTALCCSSSWRVLLLIILLCQALCFVYMSAVLISRGVCICACAVYHYYVCTAIYMRCTDITVFTVTVEAARANHRCLVSSYFYCITLLHRMLGWLRT